MSDKWDKYSKIRALHVKGYSDRKIAQILGVGRRTVRKYRDGAVTPDDKVKVKRTAVLRDVAEGEIKRMLIENESLPRKQRLNARDMWEYLVSEHGLAISYGYTRCIASEIRAVHKDAFIPLVHEMGDCVQVDWLEDVIAIIDGIKIKVQVLVFALPYSGVICSFVYPDRTMLSFLHGHVQYLNWLGGVTGRFLYDLLKTAALNGSGANAVAQESFARFAGHYAFVPEFCNRASGWEKSNVENGVKITRNNAFTPIPRATSFEELQKHISAKLLWYNMNHKIQGRLRKIWDMFLEEQASLTPLPLSPFEVDETVQMKVYPDQTVIYDKIRYSVPYGYVGRKVTMRISPFEIKIHYWGKCLFTHKRSHYNDKNQYHLDHYLEILSRKPRAANQALPIKEGIMPDECKLFLQLCPASDANNQLVEIMLLARDVDTDRVLSALDDANNTLHPSAELVKFYLYGQQMPKDEFVIEHNDLTGYDKLIGGDFVG